MGINRGEGETWLDYEARSIRAARAMVYRLNQRRWGDKHLAAYWAFTGHRVRAGLIGKGALQRGSCHTFRAKLVAAPTKHKQWLPSWEAFSFLTEQREKWLLRRGLMSRGFLRQIELSARSVQQIGSDRNRFRGLPADSKLWITEHRASR